MPFRILPPLVALAVLAVPAFAQSDRNRSTTPRVSGPPVASPSNGARGTFGTGWAQPYPGTGPQIRSDSDRGRGSYRSQTPQPCPAGTRLVSTSFFFAGTRL